MATTGGYQVGFEPVSCGAFCPLAVDWGNAAEWIQAVGTLLAAGATFWAVLTALNAPKVEAQRIAKRNAIKAAALGSELMVNLYAMLDDLGRAISSAENGMLSSPAAGAFALAKSVSKLSIDPIARPVDHVEVFDEAMASRLGSLIGVLRMLQKEAIEIVSRGSQNATAMDVAGLAQLVAGGVIVNARALYAIARKDSGLDEAPDLTDAFDVLQHRATALADRR